MIMWKFAYLLIWILIHVSGESKATLDPCLGKSALNGTCDKEGDCSGFGLVCRSGQCQCHPNYALKIDPDTKDQYCEKCQS
uniref:EB domain-containing protein n=1 Tax=Romanomermis culicivorax TaxID=13658 RepID=A0A915HR38_ROMCU